MVRSGRTPIHCKTKQRGTYAFLRSSGKVDRQLLIIGEEWQFPQYSVERSRELLRSFQWSNGKAGCQLVTVGKELPCNV